MNKENNTPNEKLFGSKTRAKLLELFYANASKSFYVREISRVIDEQINSVRRELQNLENIGIIKSENYDNKIYYSANNKHPYAHAFQEIFGKKVRAEVQSATDSVNLNDWEDYIRPVTKYLKALVVTNRVPGQEGIDMLIVGDDRTKKLTHWAAVVEKKQGRPMDYVIMSRDDVRYRRLARDRYLSDILDMEIIEKYDPEKILDLGR